jgi:hypothetical protein
LNHFRKSTFRARDLAGVLPCEASGAHKNCTDLPRRALLKWQLPPQWASGWGLYSAGVPVPRLAAIIESSDDAIVGKDPRKRTLVPRCAAPVAKFDNGIAIMP